MQAQSSEVRFFLQSLLPSSSAESLKQLERKTTNLANDFSERDFYLTFSSLPRLFGKEKINVTEELQKKAGRLRSGFNPAGFTAVQTARVMLALMIPFDDQNRYLKILNHLFSTGEVGELVALYSALPLLPRPELFRQRASEGIRSNITVVFDAIALNNPYPADYLDEDAFNQMVLKAVFIERPLDKIYGLDERANRKLARMLSDYAHERWAASRYVTPELWRPVGPFIDAILLKDIERLLEQGSELEKQAAALAVQSCSFATAKERLPAQLKARVENKEFDWKSVSEKWHTEKNSMMA
ncbi:MAG TPA: EboA domain-containing protein [Chitinophagales bacterium]|nr:EboA domain-containing protein [Chitinophagales bacterium]